MVKKSLENTEKNNKESIESENFGSLEAGNEIIPEAISAEKELNTEEIEINSFEDLMDSVKDLRDPLVEKAYEKESGKGIEMNPKLKNDFIQELTHQIYNLELKSQRHWYLDHKVELSQKNLYFEGADNALITKIFNEERGIADILKNKDLIEEFKRYGRLANEVQKTEPSVLGYVSMVNEIKRIVSEQNSISESEKGMLFRQRQKDLMDLGKGLIGNLTDRDLLVEAERKHPLITIEQAMSEEAINNRKEDIMNEYGNPEELGEILIKNYGWKKEIAKNGLGREKIVYTDEKGEVMKEFTPNLFGNYDKQRQDKEIEEMLNLKIKEELEGGFVEQGKDREKEIDNYVMSELLKFDSTALKEDIIKQAIEEAPAESEDFDPEVAKLNEQLIGTISPGEAVAMGRNDKDFLKNFDLSRANVNIKAVGSV
jgi:hypothetical protein